MTFVPEERWPAKVAPTLNAAFGKKLGLEDQHALGSAGLFVPDTAPTLTSHGGQRNDVTSDTFVATAEGSREVCLTCSNIRAGTQNNQSPLVATYAPDTVGTLTRKGPLGMGAPEVDAGVYLPVVFDPTQVTHPENRSSCRGDSAALAKSARQPHIAFSVYPGAPPDADIRAREIDCAPALTATAEANNTDRGVPIVAAVTEGADGVHLGDTATGLSSGGGKPGQGYAAVVTPPEWRVRRLTPRECERLQGFPDDWTAIPGASDGPRYAALGNSMAVPVMRWIGERIARVDAILWGAP